MFMKFKVEALTWKRNILKNKMFHLALYFDEKTNQKFSFLNKKVEKELHQNYLENHHIPFLVKLFKFFFIMLSSKILSIILFLLS